MFSRHLLSILDGDGLLDDLLLVSCQELDVDSSGAPTRSSGKNLNMVDIVVTRGGGGGWYWRSRGGWVWAQDSEIKVRVIYGNYELNSWDYELKSWNLGEKFCTLIGKLDYIWHYTSFSWRQPKRKKYTNEVCWKSVAYYNTILDSLKKAEGYLDNTIWRKKCV